jgi:hypothetical protein
MPLALRPHTAIVLSAEKVKAGLTVETIDHEETQTILGQLTPETAERALTNFGVELKQPHMWLMNLADRGKVKVGDHLLIGDRKFRLDVIKIWDAEPITAHVQCLCEELQRVTRV